MSLWIIPVKEMNATEGGASQMQCKVAFQLPDDIMAVWRFADEVQRRTSVGGGGGWSEGQQNHLLQLYSQRAVVVNGLSNGMTGSCVDDGFERKLYRKQLREAVSASPRRRSVHFSSVSAELSDTPCSKSADGGARARLTPPRKATARTSREVHLCQCCNCSAVAGHDFYIVHGHVEELWMQSKVENSDTG